MLEDYKNKIALFYKKKKRMPSYQELADLLDFASKNAAYKLVKKLKEDSFLKSDSKGKIIPADNFNGIRILGLVEAGFPSPAEEELSDTMNLDEYLIENRESTFLLKVKGDSMIDAGIKEGDIVLVERGREPKTGEIVIAEVDGDWTMKFFEKKNGKVLLVPANKKYKSIYPKEELNIAAVVRAVIRKY